MVGGVLPAQSQILNPVNSQLTTYRKGGTTTYIVAIWRSSKKNMDSQGDDNDQRVMLKMWHLSSGHKEDIYNPYLLVPGVLVKWSLANLHPQLAPSTHSVCDLRSCWCVVPSLDASVMNIDCSKQPSWHGECYTWHCTCIVLLRDVPWLQVCLFEVVDPFLFWRNKVLILAVNCVKDWSNKITLYHTHTF